MIKIARVFVMVLGPLLLVACDTTSIKHTPGAEVTSSSGKITGQRYTVELQIGHPFDQSPALLKQHGIEGGTLVNRR